ncbi:MAG: hypothetical protein LN568_00225 [Rickettsia endosymbiont of Pseudomimeciton antennatum]|nr:hypothetical protein [Rickettsia endosymbiont of Pseudomimeciton antennatum]
MSISETTQVGCGNLCLLEIKKISNTAKIMKTAISGSKKSVIFIDITQKIRKKHICQY